MQPADRVGIDERRCLERTCTQRDVDLIAALFGDGLETVLGHLLDQPCDRIGNITRSESTASTGTTTDFDRRLPGADDLGQHQAQSLVRPGHPPPTVGRCVDRVAQSGATPSDRGRGRLDDEAGLDELGEMLPDGIVVKTEMLGELGNLDGPRRVGDVPEEFVTSWIAERGEPGSAACSSSADRARHGQDQQQEHDSSHQ